jgi:hypothetical protein
MNFDGHKAGGFLPKDGPEALLLRPGMASFSCDAHLLCCLLHPAEKPVWGAFFDGLRVLGRTFGTCDVDKNSKCFQWRPIARVAAVKIPKSNMIGQDTSALGAR